MSIIKRISQKRKLIPQICISCEGDTEEIYFKHLRKLLADKGINNIKIKVDKSPQPDANSIVRYAKTLYYDGEFNKEFRNNIKIYCVFDKDENTDEQIKNAISISNKINAEIIFSNPCFEVWFYAHFRKNITQTTKNKLNSYLMKNENLGQHFKAKNNNNFNRLKPKLNTAITTSKNIQKDNKYSDTGNPHTDVFKIINYIEEIIGESITNL